MWLPTFFLTRTPISTVCRKTAAMMNSNYSTILPEYPAHDQYVHDPYQGMYQYTHDHDSSQFTEISDISSVISSVAVWYVV